MPTPNSLVDSEQEGTLTPHGVVNQVASSPAESSSPTPGTPLARGAGLFPSRPPSPSADSQADEKDVEKNLVQRAGHWCVAHKYHLLAGAAAVVGGTALVAVILRMRADIKNNRSSIAEVRSDFSQLESKSQSQYGQAGMSRGARQWP